MGIELVSLGERIPSLGKVLFVSEDGSTTLTRSQALGKINKPLSLQRAFDVCMDGDVIHIKNGEYYDSYTLLGKDNISIYFESSPYYQNIIRELNFYNCSYIQLSGLGGLSMIFYVNINDCEFSFFIKNIYLSDKLSVDLSNTISYFKLDIEDCILGSYNLRSAGKINSKVHINGCTITMGYPNISSGIRVYHHNCKSVKGFASILSGYVVFDNCILGSLSSLLCCGMYNKFDHLTGSDGLTSISYKNCIIHNILNALCDSTNPNITRLEVQNCVLQQHVTSGRIPDVYNGVIVDANLMAGDF